MADEDVGREAHVHLAKVKASNSIYREGIDGYIKYYTACVEVDSGRSVIIFGRTCSKPHMGISLGIVIGVLRTTLTRHYLATELFK